MSHSERIQEAAKEIWLDGDTFELPTHEGIAKLAAIISKHIPEQNECDHPSSDGIDQNFGPDKIWKCNVCGVLHTSHEQHAFPTESAFQEYLGKLYEEWRNRADATEDFDEWKVAEIRRLRSLATPSEPLGVTKEKK